MTEPQGESPVPPPRPAPPEPPQPRGGLSPGVRTLIVVVVGFVLLSIVAGAIGTCAIVIPQMQEKQRRFACASTLSQFGTSYVVAVTQESAVPSPPPAPGGCSYVTRDFANFPIDPRATEPQVIAACVGPAGARTHKRGTNVVFDTGSTQFLTDAELGLSPDDPLTAGPGAKSAHLRELLSPTGGGK